MLRLSVCQADRFTMSSSADAKDAEILDLKAQVNELRTQLVAMKGGQGVREKIKELSAEVIDSNPFVASPLD